MAGSRSMIPKIPEVPPEERTPLVLELLQVLYQQQELIAVLFEEIQTLKDEIARLKGHKPKPKIQPSRLEKERNKTGKKEGKRPGSEKRSKTAELKIHKEKTVAPLDIPEGSTFKGYQEYTVQDLSIAPCNTRYFLECWETPAGERLVGKAPEDLWGGHFGSTLVCYILYQHYQAHVTQPLLLEQLLELGVDISAGQLSQLLIENKERYHEEKDDILRVGLEVSSYVHVDDTTARHDGKNGYCTHIGNELFAWFESTSSKSRLNFLTLLRGKHMTDYVLNVEAIEHMRSQKLPKGQLEKLKGLLGTRFEDEAQWKEALKKLEISGERHVRIATEGALLGSVLEHGVNPGMTIMSDDAGQFRLLRHALCWVHAERTLNKLVAPTQEHRAALEGVRSDLWKLYGELKEYKQAPSKAKKAELEKRFDELFLGKTCYASLNLALERIYKNKSELLLVLERPETPLNNNLSERDIREYAKKRKISGSTRSEAGRRCRDTFASLKKTCRKLGVSFWEYLKDRIGRLGILPQLGELIRQKARASPVFSG